MAFFTKIEKKNNAKIYMKPQKTQNSQNYHKQKEKTELDAVAHTCNPSAWKGQGR